MSPRFVASRTCSGLSTVVTQSSSDTNISASTVVQQIKTKNWCDVIASLELPPHVTSSNDASPKLTEKNQSSKKKLRL
jgi:hypothetical protein